MATRQESELGAESADSLLVCVVDDDAAVRDSLAALLASVGVASRGFGSVAEFFGGWEPRRCGCIVLDVRMPGGSGLTLQEQLRADGHDVPIIFVTGYGEVPTAVKAMRAGAVDFLEKPIDEEQLLERVRGALKSRQSRMSRIQPGISAKIDRLTDREREVLEMVVGGESTRQIAAKLYRSEKTIEFHRRNIMRKLGVGNVVELVRAVTTVRMDTSA